MDRTTEIHDNAWQCRHRMFLRTSKPLKCCVYLHCSFPFPEVLISNLVLWRCCAHGLLRFGPQKPLWLGEDYAEAYLVLLLQKNRGWKFIQTSHQKDPAFIATSTAECPHVFVLFFPFFQCFLQVHNDRTSSFPHRYWTPRQQSRL